jgi:cobalt/nickel transport system ATP-binding protein
VADGSTADVLSDEQLMRANRLELPFGFDPRWAVRHATEGRGR